MAAASCSTQTASPPADGFRAGGTECRAAAGVCDLPEVCNGASAACPSDVRRPTGFVCRAPAAGGCDVAETCNGTATACPPDGFVPAGTACRAAAGACDLEEQCTGTGPVCPSDAVRPSGFACRPSTGLCDLGEACDGSSPPCPADAVRPAGTVCRAGSGDACDPDEVCDGASTACPTQVLAPAGFVCRAAADACDPVETCNGVPSQRCPVDVPTLACPGATTCTTGACELPGGEPLVFLTSTFRFTLGLAAADAECQARASDQHLAGTYVAIMSDTSIDAFSRVPDRAYHRVDGVRVCDSRADMFDGSLDADISVNERGVLEARQVVRTGSTPAGLLAPNHCLNWTSTSVSDSFQNGLSIPVGAASQWISSGTSTCVGGTRLYCIRVD